MSDNTKIEWTDATWNVVNGCSVVSAGCTNCYAMKQAHRFEPRRGLTMHTKGGMVWTGEVRFNEKVLLDPIRWKRPRRIFPCAHGDLFHPKVPDEWIDRVFAVMALAPHHTFQVLTKRHERMRDYLTDPGVVRRIYTAAHKLRHSGVAPNPNTRPKAFNAFMAASGRDVAWTVAGGCAAALFARREPGRDYPSWVRWPLPNVWLGVSTEDQARADERIPTLLDTPAAKRWLSCEPLLGPVDLRHVQAPRYVPEDHEEDWKIDCLTTGSTAELWDGSHWMDADSCVRETQIDWVVAGGESGPGARPMHPDWARSLRDQCAAAGVAFLFKQWGAWSTYIDRDRQDPDWRQDYSGISRAKSFQFLNLAGGIGFHGERLHVMQRVGKKIAGRELDGVQHDGFPA